MQQRLQYLGVKSIIKTSSTNTRCWESLTRLNQDTRISRTEINHFNAADLKKKERIDKGVSCGCGMVFLYFSIFSSSFLLLSLQAKTNSTKSLNIWTEINHLNAKDRKLPSSTLHKEYLKSILWNTEDYKPILQINKNLHRPRHNKDYNIWDKSSTNTICSQSKTKSRY